MSSPEEEIVQKSIESFAKDTAANFARHRDEKVGRLEESQDSLSKQLELLEKEIERLSTSIKDVHVDKDVVLKMEKTTEILREAKYKLAGITRRLQRLGKFEEKNKLKNVTDETNGQIP